MVSFALPQDLAPLDELLLKGDASPSTRPIMTLALVLPRQPAAGQLEAAFEHAVSAVPRMRQRVVRPAWTGARASWVDDEAFDPSYHLRRIGAPGDGSLDAALAWASVAATAPFDPARPLWEAVLVERLADQRALLVIRAHHALADGVRGIQMLASLLQLEPCPADPPPKAADDQSRPVLSPHTAQVLRATARVWVTAPRRAFTLSRSASRACLQPARSFAQATSYVRSALRTMDRGDALSSPLLEARSNSRRYATLEVPLGAMKATAKDHDVTVNDVYVAGLLGGLRRYHEAFGLPAADVPLALPIDLAGPHQEETGNHIGAAIIPGPASIADPVARLRAVHELVSARRAEPGLSAIDHLAPTLCQVPDGVAIAAMGAHSRRIDLQASNLVGPPCPVYLAGEEVERMYAFGPLPGIPAMAVLVSYQGVCTIGLTLDPAAITDIDLFVGCLRDAFDDLLGTMI